jgi:hypothetical protein
MKHQTLQEKFVVSVIVDDRLDEISKQILFPESVEKINKLLTNMQQNILDFKKRIDSGEVVFEINQEYFVTKKIYLLTKCGNKQYHVKIEYAINDSLRCIREDVKTFTDFQETYDYYVAINTSHNLYTKAGKAKIEEDKQQPEVIFENETVQMIDINSVVMPETGKTARQINLEKVHTVPLGSLVELETGVRLFVVEHVRDFDGTPLYNLCHDKNWEEGEDVELGDSILPGKAMSRRALCLHHSLESFEVISTALKSEEKEELIETSDLYIPPAILRDIEIISDMDILEKLKSL